MHVPSNILRADYAGSASCAACHGDVTARWQSAPMHLMTRLPDAAKTRAPWHGGTLRFKDDSARLDEHDGARFVQISSATLGEHLYRVTRIIGGRYREDYAGVEVGTANARGDVAARELLLPVSYVFDPGELRLKGYSVLVGERPGLRAGGVWSETCVFCHNTTPYFDSVWGALYGRGAPGYQGEVVDRLLPRERRWRFDVAAGGEGALVRALGDEMKVMGVAPPEASEPRAALAAAMRTARARFGAAQFIELGIGCEACHGGSRAHVDNPRLLPDFAPRSAFIDTRPEAERDASKAELVNRACARCHQVLFSRYPFTWEGGRRRGGGGEPGGSSITSGEARDFLLGACARQMSCVACHDPHAEDKRDSLDRLATVAGNGVCLRCHERYASAEALRAHAHHDPAGAGASCVGCHMPRKNMGLGYALTRYHRIGLPDDPLRVERDRPIECAVCHADKTVEALAARMESWWGKKYDRAALVALYGSLEARPLEATLMRGKAHEQAVALAVLGEAGDRRALPEIARQLVNPFPLVRYYARRALAALVDGRCAVDLNRTTREIAAAANACVPGAFRELPATGELPAARAPEVDED